MNNFVKDFSLEEIEMQPRMREKELAPKNLREWNSMFVYLYLAYDNALISWNLVSLHEWNASVK